MTDVKIDDPQSLSARATVLEIVAYWSAWIGIILCIAPLVMMARTIFDALKLPNNWNAAAGAMEIVMFLFVTIPLTAIPGGTVSFIAMCCALRARSYRLTPFNRMALFISVIGPAMVLLAYGICWVIFAGA